jgi:hypothetical protein
VWDSSDWDSSDAIDRLLGGLGATPSREKRRVIIPGVEPLLAFVKG